jgi:hypothetical protein
MPDGRALTFPIAFGLLGADVRALGARSVWDLYHACGRMLREILLSIPAKVALPQSTGAT